jgi:hypothetical protein
MDGTQPGGQTFIEKRTYRLNKISQAGDTVRLLEPVLSHSQ